MSKNSFRSNLENSMFQTGPIHDCDSNCVEGGLPRAVVTSHSDDVLPTWSTDGKWIYFASDHAGDQQLWKVPAQAGARPVQVTRHGGLLGFESLDGRYLYYVKSFPALGIWH